MQLAASRVFSLLCIAIPWFILLSPWHLLPLRGLQKSRWEMTDAKVQQCQDGSAETLRLAQTGWSSVKRCVSEETCLADVVCKSWAADWVSHIGVWCVPREVLKQVAPKPAKEAELSYPGLHSCGWRLRCLIKHEMRLWLGHYIFCRHPLCLPWQR